MTEGNEDKKISTLEYNSRTVYDCFSNPFTSDFGSPSMHLPLTTIDDRPPPHKRSRYAPDLLPAAISVASEDSVSNLTKNSDSPDILLKNVPKTIHVLNKDVPLKGRVHRGYCCRKHGRKKCYKKTRFYCSTYSDEDKKFYYCQGFSNISLVTRTSFSEHKHSMSLGYG